MNTRRPNAPISFTNDTICKAVSHWALDKKTATQIWGPMNKWDTSQVTTMRGLFRCANTFNEDLSEWDTSQVTDMSYMFCMAVSFSADISKWNTSNVVNMRLMFYDATSFSADLARWDTSQVADMSFMFYGAHVFSANLTRWHIKENAKTEFMLNYSGIHRHWGLIRLYENIPHAHPYKKAYNMHAFACIASLVPQRLQHSISFIMYL
jgi:surface protein